MQAIPLGKQYSEVEKVAGAPKFIFYTATSGIWQSVWLEPVPAQAVEKLVFTPDVDQNRLKLKVVVEGGEVSQAEVEVMEAEGQVVVRKTVSTNTDQYIELGENVRLWSPESPALYELRVRLVQGGDQVGSYFGMRKIEMRKVGKFHRIFLNNAELKFQLGPLDQGYWPDGLMTPPSEAGLVWDLTSTKKLGFNLVRKHIKVESERWY